jgi:hypothetical protein
MTIHPRIKLVTAEVVASIRGISREAIYDESLAESDLQYIWVFNVSANPDKEGERELRFWTRELQDPAQVQTLSLDDVINQILPGRPTLANWEVRDLLRLSREHLRRLRPELEATELNNTIQIPRSGLEKFFRRRWINSVAQRPNLAHQAKFL